MKMISVGLAVLLLVGFGCTSEEPEIVTDAETGEVTNSNSDVEVELKEMTKEEFEEMMVEDSEMLEEALEEMPGEAGSGSAGEESVGDGSSIPVEPVDETVESGEAGPGFAGDVVGTLAVSMESGNFFFRPSAIQAFAGQQVDVTFTANSGFHTFAIDEVGLDETISEGGTIFFTAPSEPGEYAFYCSIGSHRASGMEGVLIVE